MRWDATGYGSHAETARRQRPRRRGTSPKGRPPATSRSSTCCRIRMPTATDGDGAVSAAVRPGADRADVHARAPTRGTTIPVDDSGRRARGDRRLRGDHARRVPIIVERAMYLEPADQTLRRGPRIGGRHRAGDELVPRRGRDRPVLRSVHPARQPERRRPATVTIDYLLIDGTTHTKSYSVPANGRFTIWVDNEQIPAGSGVRPLDNVAVSAPSPSIGADHRRAHDVVAEPGDDAELLDRGAQLAGCDGDGRRAGRWPKAKSAGRSRRETYILIANTSAFAGQARVTLYFEDGTSAARDVDARCRTAGQRVRLDASSRGRRHALRCGHREPRRHAGANRRRARDVHEPRWGHLVRGHGRPRNEAPVMGAQFDRGTGTTT